MRAARPPRRPFPSAVLALSLSLTVLAATAATAAPYLVDTVTTVVSAAGISRPQLVVDPLTATPHVFWVDYESYALHHAWRAAGTWDTELLTYSAIDFAVAAGPAGGLAVAWVRGDGRLVCARGGTGAWALDTVATGLAGSLGAFPIDVAVGPDGQPALAYVTGTGLKTLSLARRIGGAWSTVVVDTSSGTTAAPAVAIGPTGLPQLACGAAVLAHHDGAGALGPFTRTVVEPLDGRLVALALDRVSGRPRMAFVRGWSVRYLVRDAGGAWTATDFDYPTMWNIDSPLTLALDRVGAPSISVAQGMSIEPYSVASPAETQEWVCDAGYITDMSLDVLRRPVAEGAGSFTSDDVPGGSRWFPSRRALAYLPDGTTLVTGLVCSFPGVLLASDASTVAVSPGPAGPLALAPPAPNPARAGAPLALAFTLPRAGEVAFALHDVSGRAVARRAAQAFPAGTHELRWTPPALAPGCYWLTMASDAGRAHRAVVVVR